MPDLTVIKGGGKRRDDDDGWSRHHLHSLIIELLRSIARGHDAGGRVQADLVELYRHLSKTETPLREIIADTLKEAHEDAIGDSSVDWDSLEYDLRITVRSALQLGSGSQVEAPTPPAGGDEHTR